MDRLGLRRFFRLNVHEYQSFKYNNVIQNTRITSFLFVKKIHRIDNDIFCSLRTKYMYSETTNSPHIFYFCMHEQFFRLLWIFTLFVLTFSPI
jgi:hypothetical protein